MYFFPKDKKIHLRGILSNSKDLLNISQVIDLDQENTDLSKENFSVIHEIPKIKKYFA